MRRDGMIAIGLDLGTSGLKAIAIRDDHSIISESSSELFVDRPHDGWSEQNPSAWIVAAETAIGALLKQIDPTAVRGIGLSGQMHGATLLDAADEVLRPCILWNDTRSFVEAEALDADPQFRKITGNIVFPGFTAPKLNWVRRHEPDTFKSISKVLLPKDYLRLWLTGEHVSDMSDAAGTGWLDVAARDWSDPLLAATGLQRGQMPRLVEGPEISGKLRPEIAARFGLSADVVVAGGGGDNAASAVGMGVVESGMAFVSLGTSGVLFAATREFHPNAEGAVHSFCHALPDRWHQMGVILAAADAMNWFAGVLGSPAAALTADLGELRSPSRTLFLPYLGGERTPHNDAHVRASFLHMGHGTNRASLVRAVLEGVSFAIRDSRDALASTGTRIDRLIGVGGGTRSDYWLGAIATALDLPVELPVAGNFGGAFGAARLGLMAASGEGSEIATPPPISRVVEPQQGLIAAFSDAYERYRESYTALRSLSAK